MPVSDLFKDSKPNKPHLVRPNGGLSGEVYSLRKDLSTTFSSLCALTVYYIRNPPAADPSGILLGKIPPAVDAAYEGTDLDGAVFTDAITFPNASLTYPRNITVTTPLGTTGWAGSVVVTGHDVLGNIVSVPVPILNGSTNETVLSVLFERIHKVLIPAQAGATGTITVGFGNTIGLDNHIYYRDAAPGVLRERINGADIPAGSSTFYPSSLVAPLGGYTPGTVPNGSNNYLLYYEFISSPPVDISHLVNPPLQTLSVAEAEQRITYFDPSGTWSDGQRLQVLLDQEAAGLKREIWFKPGATYYINAPVSIPSYTILRLRGCKIVSSITISDGITTNWIAGTKSTFYCGATFGTGEALFFSAIGSDTPQVTVTNSIDATTPPIEVNSKICIFQGRDASFYTVKEKVVSGSNYTLTLDRAPYTNFNYLTAKIKPVTYSPEKIQIIGDGATFSGTGDWAIWLTGAYLSKIQGCKVDDSVGVYSGGGIGFGTAGRRNIIQECEVSKYSAGSYSLGIGVMFNEDSITEKCTMYGGAIAMTGGLKNTIRDSVVHNSGIGFQLYAPNSVTTSPRGNSFYNVKAINCSAGVIVWGNNANCRPSEITVDGAYVESLNFSGGSGILVGDGSANTLINNCVVKLTRYSTSGVCLAIQAAINTTVFNCTFHGGVYGVLINGAGSQTSVRDIVTNYAGSTGILCSHSGSSFSNVKVLNAGTTASTGFNLTAPAGSVTTFNNIEVSLTATGTAGSGFIITGGGSTAKYIIDGFRCNLDVVNSTAIRSTLAGPTLYVKDLSITAIASAGRYGYYFNNIPCCIRLYGNQDVVAVATAKLGTAMYSIGTVTLTGTTPVVYAFTDVNAQDSITLTRKTAGTTPGAVAPTWTITPGTGVSVVSATAGCNDVYAIKIG